MYRKINKINNSYESPSEPSSSSGSSTDEIVTTTEPHPYLENLQLQNLLNYNQNSTNRLSDTITDNAIHDLRIFSATTRKPFLSSSESEFEGFNSDPDHMKTKMFNILINRNDLQRAAYIKSSSEEFEGFSSGGGSGSSISSKNSSQNTPSKAQLRPQPHSSAPSFGSDEISDQDVRCRKEMANSFHLDLIVNKHLLEITSFSIEPNSSDEDVMQQQSCRTDLTSVYSVENSCNAVDNKISSFLSSRTDEIKNNISFDGKIDGISNLIKANPEPHKIDFHLKLFESSTIQPNEQSPDLFANSDDSCESDAESGNGRLVIDEQLTNLSHCEATDDTNYDQLLFKRIQTSLSGVLPPPSVTIVQYDLMNLLSMYNANQRLPMTPPIDQPDRLFRPTHTADQAKQLSWPNAFKAVAHGLSYNRSTYAENIEMMLMRYAERNIGAETSSSFTYGSPSSAKKRSLRMKMLGTQSPGSRLSHLAKRRAVFSSASLLYANTTISSKLGQKQLVIDARKLKRGRLVKVKTPKRSTPSSCKDSKHKSKGRKTPGSARKRSQTLGISRKIAPTRESSKRALFQSPPKEKPTKPLFTPEVALRIDKSKRVLFSPISIRNDQFDDESPKSIESTKTTTTFRNSFQLPNRSHDQSPSFKRKREDDDNLMQQQQASKLQRLGSCNLDNLTPRSLKLTKSQSFCVKTTTATTDPNLLVHEFSDKSLFRANSEQAFQQLSNSHRQKIFWAVSTVLRKKNISAKHEHFKQYASVLAKVIKRLFLEISDKKSISTSETMLRIADKHVFGVLQGKTVDEIYLTEKLRMESVKRIPTKLSGYIAADEYEQRKNLVRRSASSLIFSQSMESIVDNGPCMVDASCGSGSQTSLNSNADNFLTKSSEFINQISNECLQAPINNSVNALCNSSSKNNNNGIVLRENVDNEQRQKSAQKFFSASFSGKDQKNVSPYNDRCSRANSLTKHQHTNVKVINNNMFAISTTPNASLLKAKRQISFEG